VIKERPYAQDALQTQLLYDIASMLEDQRETLMSFYQDWKQTVPKGVYRPLTVDVSDVITTLDPKNVPSMPWITFTIFNDGPSPVYMMVNEEFVQERTSLNLGENVTINMKKDQIQKVTLHCASGLTSRVRIFAVK